MFSMSTVLDSRVEPAVESIAGPASILPSLDGIERDSLGTRPQSTAGGAVRRDFPLLRSLDEVELGTLLAACTIRRFGRREIVFHQGDPGGSMHLVVSGRLVERISTPQGDAATLRMIGPGDAFGECALLDPNASHSATVIALEPSHTLILTRAQLTALCARHPQIERSLTVMLAAHVRQLSSMVLAALYLPAKDRLARQLVRLAAVYGSEIPLTQGDVASMAGITRATANGVLRKLEDRGVLTLARGRITVLNRVLLERTAR